MARAELIKKLFVSHSRGSNEDFQAAAKEIIEEEEKKRNSVLARSLRKILEVNAHHEGNGKSAPPLNMLPQEKDKQAPLVELLHPGKRSSDIVLSRENTRLLLGILEEHRRGPLLRSHGLQVRSKLLFCGPPGCGKTLCAEVFAHEVGLPLLFTRFDTLVSSYLGETATNLRKVFAYAEERPVVLFFDEVDAIAKARDDASEHGELKRVVNAFLQLVDRFNGRGFIVAATNHEGMLDPAIWRRFDEVVLFQAPNEEERSRLLQLKFRNFPAQININDWPNRLEGYSHAEIERICINATKSAIMAGRKSVEEADLYKSYETEQHRRRIIRGLYKE